MKMRLLQSPRSWTVVLALTLAGGLAWADDTYQVTGPILAVTDTTITVKKGEHPWVVNRDSSTKITGDLTVGAKVTIHYHMVADDVTVKPAK